MNIRPTFKQRAHRHQVPIDRRTMKRGFPATVTSLGVGAVCDECLDGAFVAAGGGVVECAVLRGTFDVGVEAEADE